MEGTTKIMTRIRKCKKKQVKDEHDQMKQAEKKRRRLEKALATSAAICSELLKKKQKKKEEQERLDQEGAAIAEKVALHVLLDEDLEDMIYEKDQGLTSLEYSYTMESIERQSLVPYHDQNENISGNRYEHIWNPCGNSNLMVSYDSLSVEGSGIVGISAGHIAAQAISSLNIGDDARMDDYVFNHMLSG